MRRNPSYVRRANAEKIFSLLDSVYPNAHCELTHSNPFELLCATILSAQCTDARVNMVTPLLFRTYPNAEKLSMAKQSELEQIIRPTGFYRTKARNLIACAKKIMSEYGGKVPQNVEQLTSLPGVGRKTANVVLGDAFNSPAGVVVDTHVKRLSQRLGLTRHSEPEKIETTLSALFPQKHWCKLSHLLIWHGRKRCHARKPDCINCEILELCQTGRRTNMRFTNFKKNFLGQLPV